MGSIDPSELTSRSTSLPVASGLAVADLELDADPSIGEDGLLLGEDDESSDEVKAKKGGPNQGRRKIDIEFIEVSSIQNNTAHGFVLI